jgi:hypothetical protein
MNSALFRANLAQTLATIDEPWRRYTGASHSNLLLGGGAPAYTATARGVLGAGVPPDIVPTTVEDRPSRFLITGLLSIISTAVSGQIGFLSSPRSRRKKSHRIWCPVARVSAAPRPVAMALLASVLPALGKQRRSHHRRSSVDQRSRLKAIVPLCCFNPSRRSPGGWPSFNEISYTDAPALWTHSTTPWTYSIGFSVENNSIIIENRWNPGILQKHSQTFLKLYFSPCNLTFRSMC